MNCSGINIDDSNYSKPMPIIGLYIAVATWVCVIAMIADLIMGFRSKQYWIPCKFVSLDAFSLTVVGVAIKLSVDLNSPMPSQIDQLAKLSTSAFICTVLVNIQPSLGKLEYRELVANTAALYILVVTSVVNLCIQLVTGVIYKYRAAHILMIIIMYCLLSMCIGSAAELPLQKNYLQFMMENRHQQALGGSFNHKRETEPEAKKLKKYLMRFSIVAQSGCPHFLLCRCSSSFVSVVWALVPAIAFFVILLASTTHKGNSLGSTTCTGQSDYGWSIFGIFITQAITVVVGMVAPLARAICCLLAAVLSSFSSSAFLSFQAIAGSMWNIEEAKIDPYFSYANRKQQLFIVSLAKWAIFTMISLHRVFSKWMFSIADKVLAVGLKLLLMLRRLCLDLHLFDDEVRPTRSSPSPETEDLAPYFVSFECEERYIPLMLKRTYCVAQKYIDEGKITKPKYLIDFLDKNLSRDFGGVLCLDSDYVHLRGAQKGLSTGWALSVLTLTSIAMALPNVDSPLRESLKGSVNEGLLFVKLIEDKLNDDHNSFEIRAAADIVWEGLDNGCYWLDIDLNEASARKNARPADILTSLSTSAKDRAPDFDYHNPIGRVNVSGSYLNKQSLAAVRGVCKGEAARSMYIACENILLDCQKEGNPDPDSKMIFKKLSTFISDILGACFMNLKRYILSECSSSRNSIEKGRETAFRILKTFGQIERIMEILEGREIPALTEDKMASLDEWRSSLRQTRRAKVDIPKTTYNYKGSKSCRLF